MNEIVIIGAGYAGVMAALRASRFAHRAKDTRITLVSASDQFVERIRLYERTTHSKPPTYPIARLIKGSGVRFVQGWVTGLDPEAKSVEISAQGGISKLPYDRLVYALGSQVARGTIPGIEEYAYTLDPHSAPLLMAKVERISQVGGQVVVIGGGLTSIETAADLAEAYPNIQVILIMRGALGAAFSRVGQDYLRTAAEELGIEVRENSAVQAIEREAVLLANGDSVPYDACIWAGGFVVPGLAREAGLSVTGAGQIIVDGSLRSVSHPDIFAVGDVAALEAGSQLEVRMSCQIAMPMGAHAGDMIGRLLRAQEPEPFQFGYQLQCVALGRKRGLAQVVTPDDSMVEKVYTGRRGAFIKMMLVKGTLWSLKQERLLPGSFAWQRKLTAGIIQPRRAMVLDM